MEQIPKLYDRINFTTIPKCILEELNTHSDRKSSISTRDENGKMITTWGDFIAPLFTYFHYNALNFYVNQKYLYDLFKWLDLGYCFDSKYNKLNRNNIENFYNEYSKGFNKGYFEFENSLKDKDSIFSTTDVKIAFKIYSQIKQSGFTNTNGQFKLGNNSFNNKDIEEKICLENDIKFILLITESAFFESGLNGGKFYKAWELILNNSTVFEPLFLKNSIAKETSQQIETKKPDEAKSLHPKHDPNLWSLKCYELFKYLFDNYYKKTKRQLTNIWFYLNEYDPINYNLKATKDDYIIFIKKSHEIKITNFDKAQQKFQREYGTINEHRINFEEDS
ncbi:MAG: hypothetical protein ACJA1B_002825 [Polaribacter sp.]|jgi:hypothetical protein